MFDIEEVCKTIFFVSSQKSSDESENGTTNGLKRRKKRKDIKMQIDVFISYHTETSLHIVEGIVNKLEARGIRCWYAPRNAEGAYASSIAKAINSCAIFLLILNRPASQSVHVLNEIDIVCNRLVRNEEVQLIPFHVADDEITDEARYYIGRIHWIDAMTPPMYKRIDELVERIGMLLNRDSSESKNTGTVAVKYRLITKMPQVRDVFEGRDKLLEQIHASFTNGKRVLFLEGIGGIGKSELAKQYAVRYQSEYDQILFVTYQTSIQDLVCDFGTITIENLEPQKQDEDRNTFFCRKMQALQALGSKKMLLIVDNFDVENDENLNKFIEGSYRIIFTTRYAHPDYSSIKVEAMQDFDVLLDIFEQNYGCFVEESEYEHLREMFELIEYHTYTVELIAKQMNASFLSVSEMLALLKEGQLQNGLLETVFGRNGRNTAFGHICSVFNTSNLNDEEKELLRCLSIMGTRGVLATRFREC